MRRSYRLVSAGAVALCLLTVEPLAQQIMPASPTPTPTAQVQPPLRPQSDPSQLTTEQLRREIELQDRFFNVRLDSLDLALATFQESVTRVPTDVDKQITQLRDLLNMRFGVVEATFANITNQFNERDVRTDQAAASVGKAIDAALQAAQERADKTENALFKQLDQLAVLFDKQAEALKQQLADVKERVITMEQRGEGLNEARSTAQDSQSLWAGIIFGLIGAAVGTGSLIFAITRSPKDPPAAQAQPQVVYVQAPPAPAPAATRTKA